MLDEFISQSMPFIQSENLNKLMLFITTLGGEFVITALSILVFAFLIKKKEYKKSKIFLSSLILGVISTQIIKLLVKRDRPLLSIIYENGYSFPSGHATISIIFFGMIIYMFKDKIKNKYAKSLFIFFNSILILAIGFSRIYLNVHWLTDVLCGYILGLICILLSIVLINSKSQKQNKHRR